MPEEPDQLIDIHFHKRHVPLPLALFIFFLAVGAAALVTQRYRQSVANYNVFLASSTGEVEELIFGSWPALENPQFFSDVRSRFIESESDFVEIDLSAMHFKIYEQGGLTKEGEIIAKGKEGWLSETPAGLYRVESKNAKVFSNSARVYMPWSINFHGNYFLHGEPYYPSGRPLNPRAFTGGCIQLANADAKEIFNTVPIGTPVLVFESNAASDEFNYEFKKPTILAKKFLAADLKNNFVLIANSQREAAALGSLTKLMTGMVASEYINFARDLTVPAEALTETVRPRLKPRKIISVINLLFPLLMESSNEAALTYANYLGSARLVNLMNLEAKSLGMINTSFADPLGKESGNVTTAEDLFKLAKHIYSNRSFLLRISAGRFQSNAYEAPSFNDLVNLNGFEGREDFIGGKAAWGAEEPGGFIGVFEITIAGEKRPITVAVLDSENPLGDAEKIVKWIELNY